MKSTKAKVRNAQKHTYNGYNFRSGLELYCYKQLKLHGLETNYEHIKFELIPAFEFGGKWLESSKNGLKLDSDKCKHMTYTPDFVADDMSWVIECKGYTGADTWLMKRKLIKWFLHGKGITVYVPSTQKQVNEVIKIIKNDRN